MSRYEVLSFLLAVVAIVVSVVSLIRTRKIQEKQLEFQKIAADLSAKQLEIIRREESARINVRLEKTGTSYKFVIANEGKAVARDIHFSIDGLSGDNPLSPAEYAEKIPIPALHPGSSTTLIAVIHMRSARRYTVRVRWSNPDGSQVSDDIFTSL
jgi:hypothetical protein